MTEHCGLLERCKSEDQDALRIGEELLGSVFPYFWPNCHSTLTRHGPQYFTSEVWESIFIPINLRPACPCLLFNKMSSFNASLALA